MLVLSDIFCYLHSWLYIVTYLLGTEVSALPLCSVPVVMYLFWFNFDFISVLLDRL